MSQKIIAWNVNGIKSLLKTKDLDNLLDEYKPHIFCMGETKISCANLIDVDTEIKTRFPKYKYRYWSQCSTKAGYSGTAIFCKKEPINIYYGLKHNNIELDTEGRVITLEYDKFILVHVYTPNSGQALNRLKWRTTDWDRAFEKYINKLRDKNSKVIVCGDLNVAHNEIDLKNPKTNLKTAGYTIEERDSFNKLLTSTTLIDSYRYLHPEKIEYSFWSYMRNAREKNIGWRIDYFLVTNNIKNKIILSNILIDVQGSDHAPITLKIKL